MARRTRRHQNCIETLMLGSWQSESANIGRRDARKDVARIRGRVCLDAHRQPRRFRNPDLTIGRAAFTLFTSVVEGRAAAIDRLIAHEVADSLSVLDVLFLLVEKVFAVSWGRLSISPYSGCIFFSRR
jgi:hypothetical protein